MALPVPCGVPVDKQCEFSLGDRQYCQDLQRPAEQVSTQQGQAFVHVRQAGVVVVPPYIANGPLWATQGSKVSVISSFLVHGLCGWSITLLCINAFGFASVRLLFLLFSLIGILTT